jgi:hypothetical protein
MFRQPLTDLPLDRFLPSKPNSTISPLKPSSKRTLSPTTPSLYSPTKRRILTQEGVFSPEKSLKAPIATRARASISTSRMGDVLRGPSSPARKLDFGTPKECTGKNVDEYVFNLFENISCRL